MPDHVDTHEDRQAQREALGRISETLGPSSEQPPDGYVAGNE